MWNVDKVFREEVIFRIPTYTCIDHATFDFIFLISTHLKNTDPTIGRDKISIICEQPDINQICQKADIFFTAVPHKTAMEIVPDILSAGKKVIDLSADFRIKDVKIYEKWYQKHTASSFLVDAVYGLPELYREDIKKTSLVANPGCYPTSVLLALAPLLENNII